MLAISRWNGANQLLFHCSKKGDDKNPDNYRGMSLLSVVSKVFTAILNNLLYTWAKHEQKISKEQAGFRKGYSTVDHMFTLTSMISKKLNCKRGGKVYVAFVDYKKAFDTVNREALWDVLQKLQTSSKMIMVLKAMYNSVKLCVRWGANLPQVFECPQWVKQGCLLSPLIFSLLISEVAEYVRKKWKAGNSITTKPRRDIPFIMRRRYCPSILHAIRSAKPDKQSRKSFQLFRADCESGQNEGDDL